MGRDVKTEGRRLRRIASISTMLVLLLFLSAACENDTVQVSENQSITETKTPGEEDWLKVYFTEPEAAYAGSYRGGPDSNLAEAIDAARISVEAAIYNMNLWSIRDALIDAYNRGVIVRVVTDSDNIEGEEFQDLIGAGIPVLGDRHEGNMHNKFIVIDRADVWTGSMNFTLNGAYEDNNNLVFIRSTEIAENYRMEFDEMFVDDLFGNESPCNTPHPVVTIDETVVETYFSPEDNPQDRMVELIREATTSIRFMAFSFTSNELGEAIRTMASNGVSIIGVMDSEQILSNEGTEFDPFRQAELDVRLDGNDGQMHHKVIIIDDNIVITGSFNFSRNAAEINDENVIIIHSARTAALFTEEFLRVLAETMHP
jgi:phosphatidylserine/phosphatidylglycerophosphate/cardiolipin synthase-like enzyme